LKYGAEIMHMIGVSKIGAALYSSLEVGFRNPIRVCGFCRTDAEFVNRANAWFADIFTGLLWKVLQLWRYFFI